MAFFKPYKTTKAKLSSLPIKEGQFICLTDGKEMFLDISDTQRIQLLSDYIKEIGIASDGFLTATSGNDLTAQISAQMKGATDTGNGSAGLVPVPSAGKQNSFLRGDATWAAPEGAVYVGEEEPNPDEYKIWIDTTGDKDQLQLHRKDFSIAPEEWVDVNGDNLVFSYTFTDSQVSSLTDLIDLTFINRTAANHDDEIIFTSAEGSFTFQTGIRPTGYLIGHMILADVTTE